MRSRSCLTTWPSRRSPRLRRAIRHAPSAAARRAAAHSRSWQQARTHGNKQQPGWPARARQPTMAQSLRPSSGWLSLQEGQHFRCRHVLGDEGLADAARQDEGQRAARHLLVLGDDSRAAPRRRASSPGMSAIRHGRPTARRCVSTRAASSGLARLSRDENRCASAMPIATPSPWTSRAPS